MDGWSVGWLVGWLVGEVVGVVWPSVVFLLKTTKKKTTATNYVAKRQHFVNSIRNR